MKPKTLKKMGIPKGKPLKAATKAAMEARRTGMDKESILSAINTLINHPESMTSDPVFGETSRLLIETAREVVSCQPREVPIGFNRWGADIDEAAVEQMVHACSLPVSVAGALMPDAHLGYGLPIGGVLAVKNAVIPYAVGMDIACRMKLSVLDLPVSILKEDIKKLRKVIDSATCFGVGNEYRNKNEKKYHRVMDEDWKFSKLITSLKDKAWRQLGTSGGGNHFVEFGELVLHEDDLGLAAGRYLALLSHSGSRGSGALIAEHYSRIAGKIRVGLPRHLSKLAWLDLNSHEGIEYWQSMELMGRYASANHELIHKGITHHMGGSVLAGVENHHNFAWKEIYQGKEVVVHRKGATPAGKNNIGVIPGTMCTPGYVVRGKGIRESLNSAAHGAGRRLSRKSAKKQFSRDDMLHVLKQKNVELLDAGLDEIPMAYKDIESVMAAQKDLVSVLAVFYPRIVKMAR